MTTLNFKPRNKRNETKDFTLSFEHISGNQFTVRLLNEPDYTLSNGHASIVNDGQSFLTIREGQTVNGLKLSFKKLNINQLVISKIGGTKKDRFTIQINNSLLHNCPVS